MRRTTWWLVLVLPVAAGCGSSSTDDTDDGTVETTDGADGAADADADADADPDAVPDGGGDTVGDDVGPGDGDGLEEGRREDGFREDFSAEDVTTDGPSPGVDCGGVACASGEECCFTTTPPTLTCVTAGSCSGGVMGCDEAADCGEGQVCCHDPAAGDIGAQCVDTCDAIPVCGSDAECTAYPGRPYCCPAMGGAFTICRNTAC